MEWLKKLIIQKILLGTIKKALDKLPLNGKKTLASIIVFALLVLKEQAPQLGAWFWEFADHINVLLYAIGVENLEGTTLGVAIAAIISAVVGLSHKLLKALEEKLTVKKEGE